MADTVSNLQIDIYFGLPGAGKTTIAAALARRAQRKGVPVYSNTPIHGCYQIGKDDIGKYMLSDCLLIIDEAGIEYNNRGFKSLPIDTIEFYKLHRHYKVSIAIFSQSPDDMDITLRRLCRQYYFVKRSLLPKVITAFPIRRTIGISEDKQIIDVYDFDPRILKIFTAKRYFAPLYWWMFDSYSVKPLPPKDWRKYKFEKDYNDFFGFVADRLRLLLARFRIGKRSP